VKKKPQKMAPVNRFVLRAVKNAYGPPDTYKAECHCQRYKIKSFSVSCTKI